MVPLLINAPSISIQRSQRSDAIIVESWWEKENLSVNSHSASKASLVNATDIMEINDDHIPSLRGWFLKEKRDKFKRHQAVLPGATSAVRRWFTIERVSHGSGTSGEGNGDPFAELALCYYKRSSSDKQGRCGWLFLNDVLSLSQELPHRWITIEHPTRVMRLQSPTPAQHRVWFSTLSKCCKNVRKEVLSPSSEPASEGARRPSLPYFSEDSVRKAKKNSLKSAQGPLPSTQKDELQFLREITGGGSTASTEVPRTNSFVGSSSSSFESSAAVPAKTLEGNAWTDERGTCEEEKENRESAEELRKNLFTESSSSYSDSSAVVPAKTLDGNEWTDEPDSSATVPVKTLEDNEWTDEQGTCEKERLVVQNETAADSSRAGGTSRCGSSSTADTARTNHTSSSGVSSHLEVATVATSSSESGERTGVVKPRDHARASHDNTDDSQVTSTRGHVDMSALRMSSFQTEAPRLNNNDRPTCRSLASARQISTSSSFRLHFGHEDAGEVLADDDFLTDDWDA